MSMSSVTVTNSVSFTTDTLPLNGVPSSTVRTKLRLFATSHLCVRNLSLPICPPSLFSFSSEMSYAPILRAHSVLPMYRQVLILSSSTRTYFSNARLALFDGDGNARLSCSKTISLTAIFSIFQSHISHQIFKKVTCI